MVVCTVAAIIPGIPARSDGVEGLDEDDETGLFVGCVGGVFDDDGVAEDESVGTTSEGGGRKGAREGGGRGIMEGGEDGGMIHERDGARRRHREGRGAW